MQAGDAALEQGEAGAGNLGGSGEVEQAQAFADIGVILDREVEGPGGAPALLFNVGGLVGAHRHGRIGNVGQGGQDAVELLQQLCQASLGCLQLVAEGTHLGHHLGSVLALPLQHADLLGQAVALGLQFLGTGLQGLALGFEGREFGEVDGLAAAGEALGHGVEIGAKLLDVEHDAPAIG